MVILLSLLVILLPIGGLFSIIAHKKKVPPRGWWRLGLGVVCFVLVAPCLAGAVMLGRQEGDETPGPPFLAVLTEKAREEVAPSPVIPPPMRILREPDGAGGMDVVLTIPDGSPRFIPSACTLQKGEACYISTQPSMPGLEVGGDHEGDTLWCAAPAWEFGPEQPFRYLILTVPHAEIVFRTTQPLSPGTYHIMIRKSPFPLGVGEYAKGIPLSRLYH